LRHSRGVLAETAAHLTDHVFPRLPVRQWVLSVPKRLRYFMQRDGPVFNMMLRIFLRMIAQCLQSNSPGAEQVDKVTLHIGAVAFIHRFGSSLNWQVHFHVCVVNGVFEAGARYHFATWKRVHVADCFRCGLDAQKLSVAYRFVPYPAADSSQKCRHTGRLNDPPIRAELDEPAATIRSVGKGYAGVRL
jgi:hypothetical protein